MRDDFSSVAPRAVAPWKIRLMRALVRISPLRSRALRRRVIALRRGRQRARRRREEARGSDRLSRPALYDMDRRLQAYLNRDGGFFVEAGANDGFEQSNTYWLERFRGWRGLLVEPVPELFREAVLERPGARVFNCALVPADHEEPTVTMRYGNLMSIVKGTHGSDEEDRRFIEPAFALGLEEEYEIEVPARTLSSLLDEVRAPEIDFLSLDVEGFEEQVLRGLDLDRHAPRYVLIEMHDIEAQRPGIEAVLGDRYAAVEQLSPLDVLFARRDQPSARR